MEQQFNFQQNMDFQVQDFIILASHQANIDPGPECAPVLSARRGLQPVHFILTAEGLEHRPPDIRVAADFGGDIFHEVGHFFR